MNDQNEDFENYLRQFRLRPAGKQFLFPRAANRLRRWWTYGITAAITAAAVIAMIETRKTVSTTEKPQPPVAPVPVTPSVSLPVAAPSPVREPAPKPSRPRAPEPPTIVPQPAAAKLERFQTQTPETKGQEVFERVCSACHDLNAASTLRLSTRADYESYVSMKRSKGARLSEEEFPILVDYLFQRFGKN